MKENNNKSKFSAFLNKDQYEGITRSKEAHDEIHYRQQKIPEYYLKKYLKKKDVHIFTAFNTKEELKDQLRLPPVFIQNLNEL